MRGIAWTSRSIAVPVMVHDHAVGAINIAWPGHRAEFREMVAQHLKTLQATAAAIGKAAEEEGDRFDVYGAGPEALFPAAAE